MHGAIAPLVLGGILSAVGCSSGPRANTAPPMSPAVARRLQEAEAPPADMTFTPCAEQRSYEAGSGAPFLTEGGVAMYRAEWPNQPFQLLGEVSFTSTAVGSYDPSARWLAAKVTEVSGNGAVLAAVETVESESLSLDAPGSTILVLRQKFRAVAVRLLPP